MFTTANPSPEDELHGISVPFTLTESADTVTFCLSSSLSDAYLFDTLLLVAANALKANDNTNKLTITSEEIFFNIPFICNLLILTKL